MKRLIGVAVLTVLGVAPLLPTVASAAPEGQSVKQFGSCLNANERGDLLVLFDESGSLQTSDPTGGRVDAAKQLLSSLSSFAADSEITLDVGIAGFSDEFNFDDQWTALTRDTVGDLSDQVEEFRSKNDGPDTDYLAALTGARRELAKRPTPEGGAAPCRAVAWFSDGKIDFTAAEGKTKSYAPGIVLNSDDAVRQVADISATELCRAGGTADSLRANSVIVFGIGLSGTASTADFDTMSSIATGDRPSACGTPTAAPVGEFYDAANVADMVFAFDELSTPGQSPIAHDSGVCVVDECEEGKHNFVLDRSIGKVRVLATVDAEGPIPTLISPKGDKIALSSARETEIGGVRVESESPTPLVTVFTMTNASAPQWEGLWSLVYIAPDDSTKQARARSAIHVTGDLAGKWMNKNAAEPRVGERMPVEIALVDSAGNQVSPTNLRGDVSMTASVKDSSGQTRVIADRVAKDHIGRRIEADLADLVAGPANLTIDLAVTTAATTDRTGAPVPGTALELAPASIPFEIGPERGYPSVAPRIDFGTIEGAGSASSALQVKGPGCVWLEPDANIGFTSTPAESSRLTLTAAATSESNCVTVAEGETAGLPITLASDKSINGGLAGTVSVSVAPLEDRTAVKTVPIAFTAELQKPLDVSRFWTALGVGLILGPGLPIMMLYVAKWMTARIPGRPLRAQQFAVSLTGSEVLRDGVPFRLYDRDLIRLVPGLESAARTVDADGIRLKAKIGISPAGAGFVVAETPGLIGASSHAPRTHGKSLRARLPLAVHNHWIVLTDTAGPADRATVLVLLSGDAGPTVRDSIAREIADQGAQLVAQLRARTMPTSTGTALTGRAGTATPVPHHDPFSFSGPPTFDPPPGGNPPLSGNPPSANGEPDPFGFGPR